LSEFFVRQVKPEPLAFNVWDTHQRGLVLRVYPSSQRSWKTVYRHHGRARWYHIADADAVGLGNARKIAAEIMLAAAQGKDPASERRAERNAGTFAELTARYVEEYAKRKNKSWRQADALVRRYLLPKWGRLKANDITRSDVRAAIGKIAAPVLANQVLASASAIFSWGVKMEVVPLNPCRGVDRNETRSRERVLSDGEMPLFWRAFGEIDRAAGAALRMILICGQRPGEVAHMRREHVKDGWRELSGAPIPAMRWPGTKNGATHRIWLSDAARAIMAESNSNTGFVFASPRGGAIDKLDVVMRAICAMLNIADKATPHDLRRTFSSQVTALGFGRDAMNRVTNHKEGGIADVYDRHRYEAENRHIMEAVATHIVALAEGSHSSDKVIRAEFRRVD
jgi:integrase